MSYYRSISWSRYAETHRIAKSFIFLVAQVRVFASFDLERDEDLLRRLLSEGKKPGVRFLLCDRSTRDAPGPESAERLRERISNVDALVVLCGAWTHLAPNVNAELRVAQELGKRYYLVKGRRFRDCSRPSTAHIDDKLYRWTRGVMNELVIRFK